MGSFGDYAENKILDHITGKTSFTKPTAFIGLSTADPADDGSGLAEPTIPTGGYARIETEGADWDAAAAGAVANAAALAFPISTDAWSTGETPLTHFAIFDAASGGNMLAHGALDTPRTVDAAGITLSFAIGELDITLD